MSEISVFQQTEMVTCVENAGVFLAESAAFLNRKGQEGGIMGMTRAKYDAVVAAGGGYEVELAGGELVQFKMADWKAYPELRTDDFAACIYAIAYIEAFGASIPCTKEGRYELFKLLFDHTAELKDYLAVTI